MQATTYEMVRAYVDTIPIIDTHEHLPRYEHLRDKEADVLTEYVSHYFKYDLFSAGLSEALYQQATDIRLPLLDRWKMLEPYWEACRFTGYGRHLDTTAKSLYGINCIDGTTIESLQQAFRAQNSKDNHMHTLFAKGHIETCLLDADDYVIDCDASYAHGVCRIDALVSPTTWKEIKRLEAFSEVSICSFSSYLQAVDVVIGNAVEQGAKTLKLGLAYVRPLSFARVGYAEAELAFNHIFDASHYPRWKEKTIFLPKPAQDYLLHHILGKANENHWVVQVHTGIQAGNANYLSNADPLQLSNLFLEYPLATFCLLHLGFPYQEIACVLAKTYPNVYLDMAWNHIISPSASIRFLKECLDLVPIHKLFAFGGDESKPDLMYGHLAMAKEHAALAFAHLVDHRRLTIDQAKQTILALFHTNPKQVYRI